MGVTVREEPKGSGVQYVFINHNVKPQVPQVVPLVEEQERG